MAKISLTRFISEAHQAGGLPRQQAWPITIVAVGEDIDSEVFIYHVQKDGDPLEGDIFEAVASPQQIYEVPKTPGAATSENTQVPYYRRDTVEFLARSAQEADDIWRIVNEDVEILVRDFNAGATLLGIERIQEATVCVGISAQCRNGTPAHGMGAGRNATARRAPVDLGEADDGEDVSGNQIRQYLTRTDTGELIDIAQEHEMGA